MPHAIVSTLRQKKIKKSTGTVLNLHFCYTLEGEKTRTKKPEVSIKVTSVWKHAMQYWGFEEIMHSNTMKQDNR